MFLLGDRMLAEGVTETLHVDDMRVVVVCPAANDDSRTVVSTTPLDRRWPNGSTVQAAMHAALREPRRFEVVAQEAWWDACGRAPYRLN